LRFFAHIFMGHSMPCPVLASATRHNVVVAALQTRE
jgi:hypothetical protein